MVMFLATTPTESVRCSFGQAAQAPADSAEPGHLTTLLHLSSMAG